MQLFLFRWFLSLFFFPSTKPTLIGEQDHTRLLLYSKTSLPEDETVSQLFKEFVKTYNKTYVYDPEEYNERLAIFKKSLERHARLNAREKANNGTALYGVNQFSDWTPQEFKEFLRRGFEESNKSFSTTSQSPCCKHFVLPLGVAPPRQDWTKKGKVTQVKNQGKCGSCWAFTAAECVETQWAIAGHPLTDLSVQEFISCSKSSGCSGGNTMAALEWLWQGQFTLVPAKEYPYVDKETTCETSLLFKSGPRIKCSCYANRSEELSMKPLVGFHGALGVNVDATMWHDYLGGIIQHHCTDTEINHAVQITGYDFNGT